MRHVLGQFLLAIWLACAWAGLACAITISVDYRYDTPAQGGSNFFGSGNPQGAAAGAQARAALESAASYFTSILNDTFSAITIPQPLQSSQFSTVVSWEFKMRFDNPSSTNLIELTNPTVATDQYLIFAGARNWTGITAGVGGPGGHSVRSDVSGDGRLTASEHSQATQTTNSFFNTVTTRGEQSGFANWGGTISFDNSSRVWHFDHTSSPFGTASDFYSVAIHELAHALGFGSLGDSQTETPWEQRISGSSFIGPNAMSQHGGNPVPLVAARDHWAMDTQSVVYGGTTVQEAAMDPDLQGGRRKRFTALDAAAMRDIGWEVIAPPVEVLFGDYNNNGRVDAADYVVWRNRLGQNVTIPNDMSSGNVGPGDYTVWRTNFGRALGGGAALSAAVPEPSAFLLVLAAGTAIVFVRRRPVAAATGRRRR
jgi:hypothetical protein